MSGGDHERVWPMDLGELTVRVADRGAEPVYHRERSLFGPWCRYEARLVGSSDAAAVGFSVFDALYRLIANQRALFDARWPAADTDAGA